MTLDDWITRDAIRFSAQADAGFAHAVDQLAGSLSPDVSVLGFGEPMHGSEELLRFRNRLFQRLVEVHGYRSIAIESSYPRGRLVNKFVHGRDDGETVRKATEGTEPASLDEVMKHGFSHGFGQSAANRELVAWMRRFNACTAPSDQLRFDGFDAPTEMTGAESPRQLLHFVLDYLDEADEPVIAQARRQRIDDLLGEESEWQNGQATFDASKSIGLSPSATALRIETEDLICELQRRRPALIAGSDPDRYRQAAHDAQAARQTLNYHAMLAHESSNRIAELLGVRDAIMAENLAYLTSREGARAGRLFAFAHNSHLQRGQAHWQFGTHALRWWSAGAHLEAMLGDHYAVIGSGVGVSDAHGVGAPEAGTLEARLIAGGTPMFIPTLRGRTLADVERASLPTRSGSPGNSSYFPLTARSLADFDWLCILH